MSIKNQKTMRQQPKKLVEALYKISQAIYATENLNELFEHVHRALSTIIPTKNFFIALLTNDGKFLTFPYNIDEKDPDLTPAIDVNNPQSLTVEVLTSKKPLLLNETELLDRYATGRNKVWGTAPKCWLGVPLMNSGTVIGVMAVQDYQKGDAYNPKDVTLLQSAAGQIAIAIERKRAESQLQVALEALRESEERFHSLFDNMGEGVALNELVFEGEKPVNYRFVDINSCFLKIIGVSREQVIGKLSTDAYGTSTPPYFEKYVEVGTSKKSIYFETYFASMDKHIAISAAPWSKSGFATIFTDITERKRAEILEQAVYEIARAADAAKSLVDLYRSVHLIIKGLMPATNFLIARYDEKEDLVSFPYFVDEIDSPPPPRKPGKGLTDYVLRRGSTLLCDAALEKELSRRGEVKRIGSPSSCWLGVPLKTGDKTIGVIALDNYSDPQAYGEREKKVLEYVSGQVANAIERKRTEEALAQERLELTQVNKELIIANEKAEKARVSAEAASQAKGMFLSRMSHEIRTPMNSVIGFSDMLLDTEMSEEQVEFVRNITKSGEALLSLINEILDFSKIEAGQLSFQNIDFDLEITAFDVCHLTQPRLGNKPVEVFCRVDDNLPAFIKSDPTRMRQVLLNLISNAIKFTQEGEIELFIAVEEEDERRLKLHTTVRDTGIGIPPDKLEMVFELFQQADGSITRKYGGTGLGLAICKQIARLMQGEVWVESELGKGSTFHFTAWVDKSEKVFVKQPQAEALAGKKALLVDDNENNLNILFHVMQLVGIKADAARRGDEVLPALQKAIKTKDPFDVCILDIQMPDMSGYEVSKQVRKQKDPLIANVKLLAFSSSVTKRIKLFKESGFDGFLPKPIQRRTLITMLKRLLGKAGAAIETDEPKAKEVVLTQHTLAEEAKHSVRILLAEDNPMNQKLAQYMLTKAGYQLEVANNGRETVEKYTAEPERYDLIFMDVHMPEMDGLEATKVLRNRGYAEIPIIALTADAMKEDQDKCLESGMNDYMSKPIKREEVFAMIQKWIFKE